MRSRGVCSLVNRETLLELRSELSSNSDLRFEPMTRCVQIMYSNHLATMKLELRLLNDKSASKGSRKKFTRPVCMYQSYKAQLRDGVTEEDNIWCGETTSDWNDAI